MEGAIIGGSLILVGVVCATYVILAAMRKYRRVRAGMSVGAASFYVDADDGGDPHDNSTRFGS